MKIKAHIKKIASLKYRTSKLRRMRYWRGHGIHSPFVYNMIREAFMRNKVASADTTIMDELLARKATNKRTAREIQKLYNYCGYGSFEVVDGAIHDPDCDMYILMSAADLDTATSGLEGAQQKSLVVVSPHRDSATHKMCAQICTQHKGISIDKFNILVLVYDSRYIKQHYKI